MKTGDDNLKQAALRWIRGEYANKTEARRELPVDGIIDDQNWYEFLKLFALFVTKAGFKGLLVFMDEGVIVEQGDPERVLGDPAQERTRRFLRSYQT